MRIVVVFESSYGNTHLIAEAIGEGLGVGNAVEVVPVAQASQELVDGADLVVGGPTHVTDAAAFDTRIDAAAVITGRASKGISPQLRHHDFQEIAEPISFLVTKDSHLAPGQEASARDWGERRASAITGDVATKRTVPSCYSTPAA